MRVLSEMNDRLFPLGLSHASARPGTPAGAAGAAKAPREVARPPETFGAAPKRANQQSPRFQAFRVLVDRLPKAVPGFRVHPDREVDLAFVQPVHVFVRRKYKRLNLRQRVGARRVLQVVQQRGDLEPKQIADLLGRPCCVPFGQRLRRLDARGDMARRESVPPAVSLVMANSILVGCRMRPEFPPSYRFSYTIYTRRPPECTHPKPAAPAPPPAQAVVLPLPAQGLFAGAAVFRRPARAPLRGSLSSTLLPRKTTACGKGASDRSIEAGMHRTAALPAAHETPRDGSEATALMAARASQP